MATPLNPLSFYLTQQRVLDAQVRKALIEASNLAYEQILATNAAGKVSAQVRNAQLRQIQSVLLSVEQSVWGTIDKSLRTGVVKAAKAAYDAERWMARDLL